MRHCCPIIRDLAAFALAAADDFRCSVCMKLTAPRNPPYLTNSFFIAAYFIAHPTPPFSIRFERDLASDSRRRNICSRRSFCSQICYSLLCRHPSADIFPQIPPHPKVQSTLFLHLLPLLRPNLNTRRRRSQHRQSLEGDTCAQFACGCSLSLG